MNLLIDVNIALDICAKRSPFFTTARDAISLCTYQGGTLWLYVGSVQTLQYNLFHELKRSPSNSLNNRQLHARALALLEEFSSDKQWLAALAGEATVFSAHDPEDEQLIRALDRFAPGTIKLLTRDQPLLDAHPDKTINPERFVIQRLEKTLHNSIDFIDLAAQQRVIRPQLEKNIHKVLAHGRYIMGPEVAQLEERLADYTDAKHCIGVASGSDALQVALMALGIGYGDEVITTPFSFIATAEIIAVLGAVPVFVDVDPKTYNMDPNLIEAAITEKTRAIMPVSL